MFGKKKAGPLEDAEATIKQQLSKLEWYQRHYEKQQVYIEELYDVVGDLSRQLGIVLNKENIERLHKNPYLEENSNFFLDLHLLFSTKQRKGKNVSCFYGKERDELLRKFQSRDFKDSATIHLTERFTLSDLRTFIKDGLWRKPVKDSLQTIRNDRMLDENQ